MRPSPSLILGVLATLSYFCAAIEVSATVEKRNSDALDRRLTGISRRKFIPNGDALLAISSVPVSTMDDDEDEDDDEEDENHVKSVVDNIESTSEAMNVTANSTSSKARTADATNTRNQGLLMNSLPSQKESASEPPRSALDVIRKFFKMVAERFHQSMNEFFDNIDKQIKLNSELPLLEQGDTFF
ncbi:HAE1 family efflux transporter, putative [Babesia ovis]|uniref:HAE1 family efflux transporter, putative n=1 Tax=Babesia ovis TaxID=5869 RepID=A0A9W5WUE5_BABOV|nr:HAE1 family efflux transporter, putative [Babesia ovis]